MYIIYSVVATLREEKLLYDDGTCAADIEWFVTNRLIELDYIELNFCLYFTSSVIYSGNVYT